MAWTPPTQKAFEPGEIPGKKTISAEEQANLDKNRPEKDVDAMFGKTELHKDPEKVLALPEIQSSALDLILQKSEGQEIAVLLDEWKDNDEFGVLAKVLENGFWQQAEDKLDESGKDYEVEDVLEIVYLRELRSIMFYFGMGMMNDEMVVVITPIPEWEEHKRWNDQSIADYVIPDFLLKLTKSIYSIKDDMTPSQVRKELIKLSFVEKHEIAEDL